MPEEKMFSENGMSSMRKSVTEVQAGMRLPDTFFDRDVLAVAPELLGKILVIRKADGNLEKYVITETEAYRGPEDKACHASKGRTRRTEVMFHRGGRVYVYLVYGMYWMLNFVTGKENDPQAVLIRGIEGYNGPGKLTRMLGIDKSFYGEDLSISNRIWVENSDISPAINSGPRIGVDYAGEHWIKVPWRYWINIYTDS
jgi:DNA-3-methyladenine glycosylase